MALEEKATIGIRAHNTSGDFPDSLHTDPPELGERKSAVWQGLGAEDLSPKQSLLREISQGVAWGAVLAQGRGARRMSRPLQIPSAGCASSWRWARCTP